MSCSPVENSLRVTDETTVKFATLKSITSGSQLPLHNWTDNLRKEYLQLSVLGTATTFENLANLLTFDKVFIILFLAVLCTGS